MDAEVVKSYCTHEPQSWLDAIAGHFLPDK